MVPAGVVGFAGVGAMAVGGEVFDLGLGKEGSVGPEPDEEVGLPSMVLLHPLASAVTASSPPAIAGITLCRDITELSLRTTWGQ